MNHIQNYLDWLKCNMTQARIDDSTVEITTPFLDRHNDYTQIYIKDLGNHQVKITDLGYIVDDLKMYGISLQQGKRKHIFNQILASKGIQYDGNSLELFVICDRGDIPEKQHTLLQTMLDVCQLRLFVEDGAA